MERNKFPNYQWERLGLKLGLIRTKLTSVSAKCGDMTSCLMECLTLWLQQDYDIDEYSLPTLDSLAKALERMGQRAVSSGIQESLINGSKLKGIMIIIIVVKVFCL